MIIYDEVLVINGVSNNSSIVDSILLNYVVLLLLIEVSFMIANKCKFNTINYIL